MILKANPRICTTLKEKIFTTTFRYLELYGTCGTSNSHMFIPTHQPNEFTLQHYFQSWNVHLRKTYKTK